MRLKADFLRWIPGGPVDPARRSLLVEFVETYMPLADREEAEFEQIVTADPQYEEVEQVITVYEKRGLEKGLQNALILHLEKRFGTLAPALKRKVRRIQSADRLDALLDAESLDDLPW